MLTIFTEHITSRLSYAFDVMVEELLGVDFQLTTDLAYFKEVSVGLNYSNVEISERPYIRPHGLLFEEGIRSQHLDTDRVERRFFHVESDLMDHDPFAAAFYLLSRYEEYLPHTKDRYGRFTSSSSVMGKENWLEHPIVEYWADEFYTGLTKRHPFLPLLDKQYRQLDTYDIDVAYAYRGRSKWRRFLASMKDLSRMDGKRRKERKAVLSGKISDPYDSYALQAEGSKRRRETRHFFLLGNKGAEDHALDWQNPEYQALLQSIAEWSECGIHPSMASHASLSNLNKEHHRFERILGESPKISRQHYLRLELPETYRRLIQLGIEEDYSMGYADHIGFRAGCSSPFSWYDLEKEERTELYVVPVSVMDSSLKDYMRLSPDEAQERIKKLKSRTNGVGGYFVHLWHNHSIKDYGEWEGWSVVYRACLEELSGSE